ncbi:MAG: type III pantothenate kinase [Cyanobium sp. PLM2.Bin73]|nr:MAG: type III pantothenate kinase [Cyanobium sp. PLM2.Bin73]
MKASEAGAGAAARWLLIGNSRWHFARPVLATLQCWSESPPFSGGGDAPSGERLRHLWGWAAVGPIPPDCGLDPCRRLSLAQVPLGQLPPWIGIDRALVGWQAWHDSRSAVLVADAGTALSFTLVDARGRFAGGRIQAGLALQLRALAGGTAGLPAVAGDGGAPMAWPRATAEAMAVGVREGLVAAVREAWQQARHAYPDCRLWITGGDGGWIAERLQQTHAPCLALAALARLSPVPGR